MWWILTKSAESITWFLLACPSSSNQFGGNDFRMGVRCRAPSDERRKLLEQTRKSCALVCDACHWHLVSSYHGHLLFKMLDHSRLFALTSKPLSQPLDNLIERQVTIGVIPMMSNLPDYITPRIKIKNHGSSFFLELQAHFFEAATRAADWSPGHVSQHIIKAHWRTYKLHRWQPAGELQDRESGWWRWISRQKHVRNNHYTTNEQTMHAFWPILPGAATYASSTR